MTNVRWLTNGLFACLLLASCTGQTTSSPQAKVSHPVAIPHADTEWTTYMGDAMRTGVGPTSPKLNKLRRTWTAQVEGDVYAEPLVTGGAVIVATEKNNVYALDAATGSQRWHVALGQPVPRSKLECGYIDPNGVTSTPVIDAKSGTVYVVAFIDEPMHHELFAISLAGGQTMWHRKVDPPGEDPAHQQQRGSLNLSRGRVYFTYGGFTGDCGNYHGWVIGAPVDGTSALASFQVPSINRGAVWAPPGTVIVPGGDVWFASSDTDQLQSIGDWDGNNGVWRLPADLSRPLDSWTPANWLYLNRNDIDQGSFAPAVMSNGLIFDTGKYGIGFLLRQDKLGGVGGEAYQSKVCTTGGPAGGSFGGAAVSQDSLYVPCRDGIVAIHVDAKAATFSIAWRGAQQFPDTPILAYGLLWTVTSESGSYRLPWKDGKLWALDPATGAVVAMIPLGGVPHFASPAATAGSIYVAGLGSVYALSVA